MTHRINSYIRFFSLSHTGVQTIKTLPNSSSFLIYPRSKFSWTMTFSTTLKNKSNKRHNASFSLTTIQPLPRALLHETVAAVISQPFLDIHNMKCLENIFLKSLKNITCYKKKSADNFLWIKWFPNKKVLSFLKCCIESENMEIMFREGLREHFSYLSGNICGFEKLNIAAQNCIRR